MMGGNIPMDMPLPPTHTNLAHKLCNDMLYVKFEDIAQKLQEISLILVKN